MVARNRVPRLAPWAPSTSAVRCLARRRCHPPRRPGHRRPGRPPRARAPLPPASPPLPPASPPWAMRTSAPASSVSLGRLGVADGLQPGDAPIMGAARSGRRGCPCGTRWPPARRRAWLRRPTRCKRTSRVVDDKRPGRSLADRPPLLLQLGHAADRGPQAGQTASLRRCHREVDLPTTVQTARRPTARRCRDDHTTGCAGCLDGTSPIPTRFDVNDAPRHDLAGSSTGRCRQRCRRDRSGAASGQQLEETGDLQHPAHGS